MDITIFIVVLTAISAWQSRSLIGSEDVAPGFTLTDFEGDQHSLEDYRGSKTIVLFWAPWCPICGAESSNLSRIQKWRGDVDTISVVLGYESRSSIKTFMDKHDVDYPVLLGDEAIQEDYHISSFPTMYVLDSDGHIEHAKVGYTTTLGMLWRTYI